MESVAVIVIAMVALIVLYVAFGLRIVKEHEQGVVMRFGRFFAVVPAGLQLIVPFVDKMRRVDLRDLAVEESIDATAGTGRVRVFGESWPAQSSGGDSIGAGTPIKLVRLEGKYVVVTKTY